MNQKVSVIVISFNAKERLRYSLASYNRQTYPKELFEVIIVDDGSTDQTDALFHDLELNYAYKYVRLKENQGRSAARNRGIREAAGEILIFSDSDMIVADDFIEKHVKHHEREEKVFVCGSFWNRIYTYAYKTSDRELEKAYRNIYRKFPELKKAFHQFANMEKNGYYPLISLSRISQGKYLRYAGKQPWAGQFEKYLAKFGPDLHGLRYPWLFFVGMNVSVKKEHLKVAGYFDENFKGYAVEDTEMGYRLFQNGLRAVVDPSIKSYHQEHPRYRSQNKRERKANLYYYLNKFPHLDTLIRYAVPIKNPFKKNLVLHKIDDAVANGVVSQSFKDLCLNLFIHFYQHTFTSNIQESHHRPIDLNKLTNLLHADIQKLSKNDEYLILAKFLKSLLDKTHHVKPI